MPQPTRFIHFSGRAFVHVQEESKSLLWYSLYLPCHRAFGCVECSLLWGTVRRINNRLMSLPSQMVRQGSEEFVRFQQACTKQPERPGTPTDGYLDLAEDEASRHRYDDAVYDYYIRAMRGLTDSDSPESAAKVADAPVDDRM